MKITAEVLKRFSIGLSALAVLVLPVAASAATDSSSTTINATVGSVITVSSAASRTINLTPGASPVVSSVSDAVSVSTNNTAGYTLTLANADTNRNLVSGSNTIIPHTGTHAAPSVLGNNTWGYAIAGSPFSATYSAENNSSSSTSLWAGVPASGSPSTLKSTSGTAAADITTVWYGVKVNATQPTGTYTDTVTYTATTK